MSQEYKVPEGWKLVPVEPTQEMIGEGSTWTCEASIYAAMLAAAPTPPAEASDDEVENVAIAIWDWDGTGVNWDTLSSREKYFWRMRARAAIAAQKGDGNG